MVVGPAPGADQPRQAEKQFGRSEHAGPLCGYGDKPSKLSVVATVNDFLTVGFSRAGRGRRYSPQSPRQSKVRSASKEEPTVTKAVTVATRF